MTLAWEKKIYYGIWIIGNDVIDNVGIREANRRAMLDALIQMTNYEWQITNEEKKLLIDGRDNYVFNISGLPEPEYIVRGDTLVPQIMAASILAKVTRDHLMMDYEVSFPGYGFSKHKGYGTSLHQKSLCFQGVCPIHRKSYRPIMLVTLWKKL